ncbi:EamA family transporter [Alteromonas sp. a30]|uniref:EamA family transporter n=1 Tax=Alteromonas sp. a30 TaxID=2730917 RepID=UPI00227FC024|nr:EamA family transporter [Alteromonas sp. a30]MCY7295851.1 EamA family transporter [Alteromonas sp. a30]
MTKRDLLIAIALMCLWGLNFSVIKLGADQINPVLLTALRFTFAVFPAIFFIAKPKVPAKYLVAYGLCFGVGLWGMMTWSINLGLSAGMAGILMQLSLVFSLILSWLVLKEKVAVNKLIGALLAIVGLAVSLTLQDGSAPKVALIFVLFGALSWSLVSLIVKMSNVKQAFAFSVWGMAFAPIPLVVIAWLLHGPSIFIELPSKMNATVWFSVLFQAYPTTLLGYLVWNKLVLKYPLSTVSLLTTLVPVFGMLGSVVMYNESLSSTKWLVCSLILAGLFISQAKWRRFSVGKQKRVSESERTP